MDSEHEGPQRRLPSLVQLCQRTAVAQIESIHSLGEHLSYPLVKPILQRCSVKQLHRFEQSSPHLQQATPELWKDLCFRECRLTAVGRYSVDDDPQEPESWRSRCLLLKVVEEKLLEEARSKLRSKLMKAVEHKKEREVKYTDRVPPPKRLRTGWNTSVPAKTLFQKTRSDASKLQKTIYNARILPPMPTAKNYGQVAPHAALEPSSSRVTVNTVLKRHFLSVTSETALSAQSASESATSPTASPNYSQVAPQVALEPSPSRVTVNTVIKRRVRSVTSETALSAQSSGSATSATPLPLKTASPAVSISSPPATKPTASDSPRIVKSPPSNKTIKKDPMAALFVPKRKAYSQRPV